MAGALTGVTLPAVVEELLSEMAAAVQEEARSTGPEGVRGRCGQRTWPAAAGRGGEGRSSLGGRGGLPPGSAAWCLRAFNQTLWFYS